MNQMGHTGTAGYTRTWWPWGVPAGPELVRSIMRERDLEPCQPRPWRFSLTEGDGQEHDIPDLEKRDFTAAAPGEKMVGDITYIPTWEGKLHLSVTWNHHGVALRRSGGGPIASPQASGDGGLAGMDAALPGRWPVLGRHERAAEWLGIWADLGRAPRRSMLTRVALPSTCRRGPG
ncbi:MAG: hypothetical protein ACLPKE_09180 [Streptosporangiaceae bacterium]